MLTKERYRLFIKTLMIYVNFKYGLVSVNVKFYYKTQNIWGGGGGGGGGGVVGHFIF